MSRERFPILILPRSLAAQAWSRAGGGAPDVPFALVKEREAICMLNHHQTPEQLADRGGLSLCELAAVFEGRRWRAMPFDESAAVVLRYVQARSGRLEFLRAAVRVQDRFRSFETSAGIGECVTRHLREADVLDETAEIIGAFVAKALAYAESGEP